MSGKRWAALIIAVGLFFVSVIIQLSSMNNANDYEDLLNMDKPFKEKVVKHGKGLNKIAVINIQGIIQDTGAAPFMSPFGFDHQGLLKSLENAGEDPAVKGIVLKVNTPGGGVVESAEIHDKILEAQELYDKPVYSAMGNTAASGGYYVSAPADKIFAHPGTLTGSIGVIMENINFAELADTYGIDFNTITSGEYKDIMSSSREMTEDERAILQSMVDELYGDFVQVIVEGRDMTEAEVKAVADGRVFTGRQAQANGLVDDIGTFDDAVAMMQEDYGLEGASLIEYEANFGFGSLLGFSAESLLGSKSDLDGIMNLIRDSGPRAMYLYSN